MKNRRIQLEEIQIEKHEKIQALDQIRDAVEAKNIRYQPSLLQILLGQIKYLSWSALGGQASCLLVILGICRILENSGAQLMVWLGTGSVLASCVGVFLMLELCRSSSFHMTELEQSCYLNVKQLWCVKMIIFGCLDLLVLTVLIAGVSKNVSCGIFSVMLYFLVPFVFSSGLQLFVFTIYRKDRREYLQMGAVILISILSLLTINIPGLYTFACLWIWGIALILGTGLLAAEIMLLYQMICQGDELCILDD